ncbi:hypothetical protein CSA56_05610 [candidate division KSB3 bacterium]|uniref:Response regulatory domain-containing protein n=1 Tax=candidate division KSB3 bacterium TaxID=2044937 RepID=A0A2G6KHD5_9BACT|nr:MAG: hypothetical protein CSA56_05610 [candidate division KSB3 bacterium]
MNILLIDDDENLLKRLARPLKKCGHSISEAIDGRQGWELFLENPHRFDVIVTDIKMPVLDGVELLKRLRKKNYDTPVIIISDCEDIKSSIEVLRFGAFDFLLKPFQVKELVEILKKLEAIHENQKELFRGLPFFTEDITISIHSQTQQIPHIGAFLQERVKLFCKMHKISIHNIGLCLHEALVNAVVHGNLEIPSSLKNESPEHFNRELKRREADSRYAERKVFVRCKVTANQLIFDIEDEGNGFEATELVGLANPLMMSPSGRGVLIIMALMDEVSWNDTGNRITMIKYFNEVSQEKLL